VEDDHDFWCPRCDQGWVDRVLLAQTAEIFLLCDECEGVWWGAEPARIPEFTLRELADQHQLALPDLDLRRYPGGEDA